VRVFLDTNVLVSAFATRGLCADLLRDVLARHELVTGEVVLSELRRVLTQRIGVPAEVAEEIDRFLRGSQVVPRPAAHCGLGLRDPDDEWIVASTVAGGADLLVTGDAGILAAAAAVPLPIWTPRESWRLLRGGGWAST
jgi:putative PIN family toxin of toxin-antitoxin system